MMVCLAHVKGVAEVESRDSNWQGVMTQCFTEKTMRNDRGWSQVAANITLKICMKLGGINHIMRPLSK